MSKSRQEKTRTPAQTAPPPPVSNDIVPGRFTEADWNQMVEGEDGEDFIFDIVQEVVESTMQVLHDCYIRSQTLPYAVQEARDLLLHIIEWQFLACDIGEDNPSVDSTWLEEEEPVAPVTDSWAQGSVPVMMQRSSTAGSSSALSESNSESSSLITEDRPHAPEPPFENLEVSQTPLSIASPLQPSKENTPKTGSTSIKPKPLSQKKVIPARKKRSGPFKPHKGKLPAFSGVNLTSLTDAHIVDSQYDEYSPGKSAPALDEHGLALLSSSTSILKVSESSYSSNSSSWGYNTNSHGGLVSSLPSTTSYQAQQGRPPGSKDVVYDERGNVVAVVRINPDKLPSHRVRTKFTVVDPETEAFQMRTRNKPAKGVLYTIPRKDTKKGVWSNKGALEGGATLATSAGQIYSHTGEITPLPPPLVDSMDINAGVVVREGGVVRRGPRQVLRRVDKRPSNTRLQPLDSTASARGVTEVVSRSSPIIRPLHLTDPIPPIMSHSPAQ